MKIFCHMCLCTSICPWMCLYVFHMYITVCKCVPQSARVCVSTKTPTTGMHACLHVFTVHVRGSFGMCLCVCVRTHLSGTFLDPRNHQRLHYNQPQNGREHRLFLRLSNKFKLCFLFQSEIPCVMWNTPRAHWRLSQHQSWTAAQCSQCNRTWKGLLSKHFLGPESSLMRILIAVTHADEGSMGQAPYSDIC